MPKLKKILFTIIIHQ